ncbi:MAG: FAD-dependent oxidoreductase, partial [Dehalococcoidia bacterium]|nr:FAD-dependent oxidoreductase [Dehalococcoidia bacterium]
IPTHKSIIGDLTNYFVRQVKEQGVRTVLGHEASAQQLITEKPDVVILASGSRPLIPKIPGIDSGKVMSVNDALTGPGRLGKRVVIIGGGLVGCETAEFLADNGHEVTIIEMRPEIAIGVGPSTRPLLLERLALKGIVSHCDVRCDKVDDKGVAISGKDGTRKVIEADTVVLAAGAISNRDLVKALEGQVPEVHLVGDCVEPRCIADAVEEGARIGLAI